jgi:hypothetical protein
MKESVEEHVNWLTECESSIIEALKRDIKARHEKEISCCQRLVDMIGDVVTASEPIREQWLLAPDVIAVIPTNLIVPFPPPPLEPNIQEFYSDKLNDEQHRVLSQWLSALKCSKGNMMVEDVDAVFDRCTTKVGPISSITSSGETLHSLFLPQKWGVEPAPEELGMQRITKEIQEDLKAELAQLGKLVDIVGSISVSSVLKRFTF